MRFIGSIVVVSFCAVGIFACAADANPGSLTDPQSQDGTNGGSSGPSSGGPTLGHPGQNADGGTTPSPSPSPSPSPTGTGTGTGGKDGGTPPPPPPPPNGASPQIGGCNIFPADNPWNRDVSNDPVDTAAMTNIMPNMHGTTALHPDWGDVASTYGIPFTVSNGAPAVLMTWSQSWGNSESDVLACGLGKFCYPIPSNAKIEGGASAPTDSDRHVLVLDTTGAPNNCTLYELYHGFKNAGDSGWTADNGAVFHLGSDALRPDGWTSSDAAGLPVLPGLVRWDEVASGEIKHALRFTMNNTYNGYIHPATHAAGLSSNKYPPMGMRMRLKASFDTSGITGPALVIVTAMKKYGVILADNGSNWYVSGETNDGWTNTIDGVVSAFGKIHGSDFEIVQSGAVSQAGL